MGGTIRRACVVAVAVLAACEGDPPEPTWSVTDSLGIRIIASEPTGIALTVSPDPRLSLGTMDGDGPTQFFRVQDIELLPDSAIAVADQGSEEVRIFEADGTHRSTFGGEGYGPQEFRRLDMIEEGLDSLFVYDGGNDRVQVRTLAGEFGRTFRLEWFYSSLSPVHVAPDASILAITGRYMTELNGTGRVVDTALVSIYQPDGLLVDSLLRVPHNTRFVKQVGDYRTTIPAPFSTSAFSFL